MRLPGVCSGCRLSVFWNGLSWRAENGKRHVCAVPRAYCGAWMRYAKERCARTPTHGGDHRTAYAMENQRRAHRGEWAA